MASMRCSSPGLAGPPEVGAAELRSKRISWVMSMRPRRPPKSLPNPFPLVGYSGSNRDGYPLPGPIGEPGMGGADIGRLASGGDDMGRIGGADIGGIIGLPIIGGGPPNPPGGPDICAAAGIGVSGRCGIGCGG